MSNIQETAIIRDRGQLTIPEKIRESLRWPTTNSVVSISTTSQNELVIKPYIGQNQIDWSQIWTKIELSRSYEGKKGNLSKFISLDRGSH